MVALSTREELRSLAEKAGRELDGASALEILGWADEQFGSAWAVASSMADAVVPSLAAKVHLSAPACLRRVERLKQKGLITGIVALLNPRALDAGMLVMIGVVLDRSTPESFAAFEKAAVKVSGCLECHVVTGEFDYFMLLRTRDHDSFNRLHAEQLLHLPGVRQIRSFMVLKQVLSTTQFPI